MLRRCASAAGLKADRLSQLLEFSTRRGQATVPLDTSRCVLPDAWASPSAPPRQQPSTEQQDRQRQFYPHQHDEQRVRRAYRLQRQ